MTLDLNAIKARTDKALASLAKAYPYLVKHADHIDGEFDNALSTVRQEIERLTAERDEAAMGVVAWMQEQATAYAEGAKIASDPYVQSLSRLKGEALLSVLQTIREVPGPLSGATSRLARLTADHAALRTVVQSLEWSGTTDEESACPACGCWERNGVHATDCRLVAALGGGNG